MSHLAAILGTKAGRQFGEVSEWFKEHAWKACKSKGFVGSNPTLTAISIIYRF